jgi:hypothetical protein
MSIKTNDICQKIAELVFPTYEERYIDGSTEIVPHTQPELRILLKELVAEIRKETQEEILRELNKQL